MPPKKGNVFLLKVGDGEVSEVFTTVAALRGTSYTVGGEEVNVTHKDAASWRVLLDGGGEKTVSISADGLYDGSAQHKALRDNAMDGALHNYQIDDGDEILEGAFQVGSFEHVGNLNEGQTYSITLESSGEVAVSA